jgi:hypothetical protein
MIKKILLPLLVVPLILTFMPSGIVHAASSVGDPSATYQGQGGYYYYITIPLHETCVTSSGTEERDYDFVATSSYGQQAEGTHRYRFYGSNDGTIYIQMDNGSMDASYCDQVNNGNVVDTSDVLKDVTLSLDQQNPSLTVTAPVNGAQFSGGSLVFSGTASDNISVASVTVDGQAATLNGTSWTYTRHYDPNTYGNLVSTVTVKDAAGRSKTTVVSYTQTKPVSTPLNQSTKPGSSNKPSDSTTPKTSAAPTNSTQKSSDSSAPGTDNQAKDTISKVSATKKSGMNSLVVLSIVVIVLAGIAFFSFKKQWKPIVKKWF